MQKPGGMRILDVFGSSNKLTKAIVQQARKRESNRR